MHLETIGQMHLRRSDSHLQRWIIPQAIRLMPWMQRAMQPA